MKKIKRAYKFTLILVLSGAFGFQALSLERPEVKNLPEGVKAALKEKFASERPQHIKKLEEKMRTEKNYYDSLLSTKELPCGSSKGYVLNNSLELVKGFYSILASEFQMSGGAAKYHKMFQPIADDQAQKRKGRLPGSSRSEMALTKLLEFFWDGKVIKETTTPHENYLINSLFSQEAGLKAFKAKVYFLENRPIKTINIDYSISPYQIIRNIRDEIRQVSDNLYLGKAFYKGTYSDEEVLFLYFALDFSQSPSCEKTTEALKTKDQKPFLEQTYPTLKACEKRDTLWKYITDSKYQNMTPLENADAFGLFFLSFYQPDGEKNGLHF